MAVRELEVLGTPPGHRRAVLLPNRGALDYLGSRRVTPRRRSALGRLALAAFGLAVVGSLQAVTAVMDRSSASIEHGLKWAAAVSDQEFRPRR